MARTTDAAVKLVLAGGREYEPDPEDGDPVDLTPYIDAASALVDDAAEYDAANGNVLSTARKELIERWLAAHFYQQSDPGYQARSTEGASGQFTGKTDFYLLGTRYGQHAVLFDKSGYLWSIAGPERKTAGGFWAGKAESEQLSYDERNI